MEWLEDLFAGFTNRPVKSQAFTLLSCILPTVYRPNQRDEARPIRTIRIYLYCHWGHLGDDIGAVRYPNNDNCSKQ